MYRQQHAHTEKEVTPCLHDHEGDTKNQLLKNIPHNPAAGLNQLKKILSIYNIN